MLRFKLRTLLLTTAITAAVIGYYGHRIPTLSKAGEAYEKLALHWAVGSNQTIAQNSFRKFIDWPARKFLENEGDTIAWDVADSTSSLWLREIGNENSLEGLEHFRKLTQLELNPRASGIEIDGDEFKYIAKLKRLDKLFIEDCHVSAEGLTHLQELELSHLKCGSRRWGNNELDEIGKLTSLRELSIYCSAFHANRIQNLKELKALSVCVSSLGSLDGIEKLTKLESILLWGFVSDAHLAALKNVKGLKQVTFQNTPFEGDCIEKLLEFPALEKVKFVDCWPNIQKLEAAGITVEQAVPKY